MKNLPKTQNALVLRTDFSDERAWESIRAAILRPVGIVQFRAYVDFVSDPAYTGISVDQLVAAIPESAHLTQPPPNPREIVPELPSSAAHAIWRALAKHPDERYATAGEFVAAMAS